jgi:hypothetical protein
MQHTDVSPISSNEELFDVLNKLIDAWCERRALNALRLILPGYFAFNGLTDGWEILYEALRDVRAFCRQELTAVEKEQVGRAVLAVQKALDRT